MNRLLKPFILVFVSLIILFFATGCINDSDTNADTTQTTEQITTINTTQVTTDIVTTQQGIEYVVHEGDYVFRSDSEGVEIIAYTGSPNIIQVPEEIGGEPVIKIGNYAFSDNTIVERVKLPESIIEIGDFAFAGAANLEILELPASLIIIGQDIIQNCESLREINVAEGNDLYYSSNGILFRNVPTMNALEFSQSSYSALMEEDDDYIELLLYPQGNTDTYYAIETGVQAIGEYAFKGNQYLEEIVIPNTVVEIRTGAFMNCSSLETLVIPGTVTDIPMYMCYQCSSLANLTLSEGILTIGRSAFQDCVSLSTLAFPISLTDISIQSFSNIGAVQQIHLHDGLHIDGSSFESNQSFIAYTVDLTNTEYQVVDGVLYSADLSALISYPSGKLGTSYEVISQTTAINNGAFQGNYYLEGITFAGNIALIDEYAFAYCRSLQSMEIPENVSTLGMYTFYASEAIETYTVDPDNLYFEAVDGVLFNEGLSTLYFYPVAKIGSTYNIPSTVTEIISLAFFNNLYLENIVVPSSLVTIGGGVFASMNLLVNINVDSANTAFTSVDGVLYSSDMTTLYAFPSGRNIETFVVPASVTLISYGAFQGQQYLEYLVIPDTVQDVLSHAFRACPHLEYVVLPTNLGFVSGKMFMESYNVTIYFENTETNYQFYLTWNLENRPYYFLGEWAYDNDGIPQIINTGSY